MALTIKTKVLLSSVFLVVAASAINIGVAGISVTDTLTTDLINRIVLNTKSELNDLTNYILIGDTKSIISLIYNQKSTRKDLAYMLVLDEQGSPIASTLLGKDPVAYANLHVLPEGENERVSVVTTEDGEIYDIALRLDYDKGILRAGYYKSQIDMSVTAIIRSLLLGAIFAIFVAVISAVLFTRVLLRPLMDLKETVRAMSSGNLSARARITSKDEIGEIALAFNDMAEHLATYTAHLEQEVSDRTTELEKAKKGLELAVRERTVELENTKSNLEKLVEDRTKQLNEKLAEAEAMNHLMVGRELKMIELKNEIAKLSDRVSRAP